VIKEFAIPTRVKRKLVVGYDIGALLRIGPAPRDHDRDFGIAELARRQDTRVAGNNPACLVGKHRIRPAPLLHARRKLRDLSL